MSETDTYGYDLISCDVPSYPSILNKTTWVNPHPMNGLVVYIDNGSPQAQIYTLTPIGVGANTIVSTGPVPNILPANLTGCADPNNDKYYRVRLCGSAMSDPIGITRDVFLVSAQTIGDVLNFTGECGCWEVVELLSTYLEVETIANTYVDCASCLEDVAGDVCDRGERTIGYAVKVSLPKPEPPDRLFAECCYSNLVFGDIGDTDPYKNDFSSVYFQKQTSTDTVVFQIVGVSTGVTALVDVTHGTLYPFAAANTNPDLSYFKVEWRKILLALGLDIYTIRMVVTIAGVGPTNIDSNSFDLRPFSIDVANNTTRIDGKMDGLMEKINIDFKNSDYETSLRVPGYFGDAQESITQDMVVFGQKKGVSYYESQITMSNDPDYIFQANNIPECISRELRKFIIFSNEIFISDYNKNNHSYEYELLPVTLSEISPYTYPVLGRGVNIEMTFKNRSKNDRKTNC